MKIGLIARADERGLGRQTHEFWRHLPCEAALVVDMGEFAGGFEQHHDRYPDDFRVTYRDGGLHPIETVEAFCDAVDVIYTAETTYQPDFCDIARAHGAKTVVHVNPEFFRWHTDRTMAPPDRWWAPTPWRLGFLPKDTRVVPVPVADDLAGKGRLRDNNLSFLHVIGRRAAADRNGTRVVTSALRDVDTRIVLTITTQDERLPFSWTPGKPEIRCIAGGVVDHAELYELGDVLLLPRRYGGLCLPAQEAMAAGMVVVMGDCPPQNETWPVLTVPGRYGRPFRTQAGPLRLFDTDSRLLADTINGLTQEAVREASARSLTWAAENTWAALTPTYLAELEA